MTALNPGEQQRYQCDKCLTEYEILLEPKTTENDSRKELDRKLPSICPFCGSADVEDV